MMWKVEYHKRARKYLDAMPQNHKDRIEDAIKILEDEGPDTNNLDIKQLKNRPERRLRVGKWRILFIVIEHKILILVTSIDSRGDVYKN